MWAHSSLFSGLGATSTAAGLSLPSVDFRSWILLLITLRLYSIAVSVGKSEVPVRFPLLFQALFLARLAMGHVAGPGLANLNIVTGRAGPSRAGPGRNV